MEKTKSVVLHYGDAAIQAEVIFMSSNQKSLLVVFEGIFLGYVDMMPLVWSEDLDAYIDLFSNHEVVVQWSTLQ